MTSLERLQTPSLILLPSVPRKSPRSLSQATTVSLACRTGISRSASTSRADAGQARARQSLRAGAATSMPDSRGGSCCCLACQ